MLNRRGVLLGGSAAAAAVAAAAPIGAPTRAQSQTNSGTRDDIAGWLKTNAIPLTTAEPAHGSADLEPLRPTIDKARIVSLGEATHGTREFFQLKHRIMEYCVAELGFTVIGFEADYGATLSVNDYVLGGTGDAADVVAGMGFWTWNTDEVLDLVEWVRAWNSGHERKVKFYGFDMQSGAASALQVLAYLERVSPALAAESEQVLGALACPSTQESFDALARPEQEAIFAQIKTIHAAFQQQRPSWTEHINALDWNLARLGAVVLEQYLRSRAVEDPDDWGSRYAFRDRCMAANVLALLEAEGPDTRALLWAHNGHVEKTAKTPTIPSMGHVLHAALGAQLLVFGFAFNQGGFAARSLTDNKLKQWTVGPAPDDFIEASLAATGFPLLALDLARVPRNSAVAAWMADGPHQRSIGAVFDPRRELYFADAGDPREMWDVLLFVETTTAARRTRAREQHSSVGMGFHAAPSNLELAGAGAIPDGWLATNLSDGSYAVSIADERLPAGGHAMRIAREPRTLPWGDVTLSQFFRAARWRGRRLVFTAAMRTQVPRIGAGAHIAIRVFSDDPGVQPRLAVQPAGPVRSSRWTERSVAIDVPSEARWIEISLVLAGSGSAWFGRLQLSSVESPTLRPDSLQFSKKPALRDRQLAPPGVSLGPELLVR